MLLDGLAGAEIGAKGGVGALDDLVCGPFVGHFLVDVAQFCADGGKAVADELLGFAGGFAAGGPGLDVIGFDESVEDVFCFGGVVCCQFEDEDAGISFFAAGDGQVGQEGACGADG